MIVATCAPRDYCVEPQSLRRLTELRSMTSVNSSTHDDLIRIKGVGSFTINLHGRSCHL